LSGFVEVRKCTLFQGEYPPSLLKLWDQFKKEKGSENYRPDYLPSQQEKKLENAFTTFEGLRI